MHLLLQSALTLQMVPFKLLQVEDWGRIPISGQNGNTSNSLSGLVEFSGYAVTVTDSIGCSAVDSVFVPEHIDSIQPIAVLKDTVFLFSR